MQNNVTHIEIESEQSIYSCGVQVIDVLELCKLCSHFGDPLLICSQA